MTTIALLDLLRKNPTFGSVSFSSRTLFSIHSTASFAFGAPFAIGALFGDGMSRVAFCDAGTADMGEDFMSSVQSVSRSIFLKEGPIYSAKEYNVQTKPLFSAFHWKTLGLTSLRSFVSFYLPLLEHGIDEDDDDFLQENSENNHVDLVVPFKKSVKQISRETSVVTTRRVLERLAAHCVSERMAWKLLKDVPKSAARKAGRKLPTLTYIFCVSRTTCRGHFLGVLASWIVQVGIDIYRFFKSTKANEDDEVVDVTEPLRILVKKIRGVTFKCGGCLIFASVGAGIGAKLIRPAIGQWIGCAAGDLAGPIIITYCFEKLQVEL